MWVRSRMPWGRCEWDQECPEVDVSEIKNAPEADVSEIKNAPEVDVSEIKNALGQMWVRSRMAWGRCEWDQEWPEADVSEIKNAPEADVSEIKNALR